MAKLHGAAKAKFLARMARGRKKSKRRTKRTSPRRAKARRKNPLYARHGIDRNERIYPSMVKRTANPRKRKRRKSKSRRRSHARRRNPIAYLVNPSGGTTMARKRRKHRRARKTNPRRHRRSLARRSNPKRRTHRRRRNPGLLGGLNLKSMIMPTGAALAGGFVGGFLDAKLSSKSAVVQKIGSIAAGIGGGLLISKFTKNATAGAAFMGSIVGGISRAAGASAGGGIASHAELAALAGQIASSEDMGTLLNSHLNGYGLLLSPMNGGMSGGFGGAYGTSGAELDALSEEPA